MDDYQMIIKKFKKDSCKVVRGIKSIYYKEYILVAIEVF
jgi:hypothetical protein